MSIKIKDIFKCLVLSDQQSKRYPFYNYIKLRKKRKSSHFKSWNQIMFGIISR